MILRRGCHAEIRVSADRSTGRAAVFPGDRTRPDRRHLGIPRFLRGSRPLRIHHRRRARRCPETRRHSRIHPTRPVRRHRGRSRPIRSGRPQNRRTPNRPVPRYRISAQATNTAAMPLNTKAAIRLVRFNPPNSERRFSVAAGSTDLSRSVAVGAGSGPSGMTTRCHRRAEGTLKERVPSRAHLWCTGRKQPDGIQLCVY